VCRAFRTAWLAQVPILASVGHSGERSRQDNVINMIYLGGRNDDDVNVKGFGMPIEMFNSSQRKEIMMYFRVQ